MSYYDKYCKYKKKYLALKGGAESKQGESKSDPAANKPNLFYRFDENDLSQKRLPIHLQLGFIKHLTCEETKNLLETNKSNLNTLKEDYWKKIIENVKVNNFDYNSIKLNLNRLKEKNPKYYMKVDKDLKSTFCINLTSEKKKELCLQFYLKCIYKKLIDKYTIVDKNTWYESIRRKTPKYRYRRKKRAQSRDEFRKEKEEEEKLRRNSVNDYKYFDYFTDTTSIGDNAFKDERNLESIIIPDSVVSIGKNAFLRCNYLDSVTFPEGLTSIGNGAFLGCNSLQKIYIPRSIDGIVRAAIESGSIPKLTRRFGNNYVEVTIIYSN